MDAAQFNREDLDAYIRDDDLALCLVAERFETVPTNVLGLLERHVTKELPLSPYKLLLLVLPRGSEPEKVVGCGGRVGDRSAGLRLRQSQLEDTLSSRNIPPAMKERVMFFDPLLHYEDAGNDFRLSAESSDEDVDADRAAAWTAIFDSIKARDERVWDRVNQIAESLKRIVDGKGLDQAEEELVKQARAKILEYRYLNLANADRFVDLYRRLWDGGSRNVMTLRATNNRFGLYPHRNIDIYYDAVPISEEIVRAAGTRQKDAVIELVQKVRESASEESDLRELTVILEGRIDILFEEVVRAVGRKMHDYLKDAAFAPLDQTNAFWTYVQKRWGGGSGYGVDVLTRYADQLQTYKPQQQPAAVDFLVATAEESWRDILIDPVLQYLG
ncbi:MAG: hypothetical protein ACRELB_17435 [Polyangiaceae bacterium]